MGACASSKPPVTGSRCVTQTGPGREPGVSAWPDLTIQLQVLYVLRGTLQLFIPYIHALYAAGDVGIVAARTAE